MARKAWHKKKSFPATPPASKLTSPAAATLAALLPDSLRRAMAAKNSDTVAFPLPDDRFYGRLFEGEKPLGHKLQKIFAVKLRLSDDGRHINIRPGSAPTRFDLRNQGCNLNQAAQILHGLSDQPDWSSDRVAASILALGKNAPNENRLAKLVPLHLLPPEKPTAAPPIRTSTKKERRPKKEKPHPIIRVKDVATPATDDTPSAPLAPAQVTGMGIGPAANLLIGVTPFGSCVQMDCSFLLHPLHENPQDRFSEDFADKIAAAKGRPAKIALLYAEATHDVLGDTHADAVKIEEGLSYEALTVRYVFNPENDDVPYHTQVLPSIATASQLIDFHRANLGRRGGLFQIDKDLQHIYQFFTQNNLVGDHLIDKKLRKDPAFYGFGAIVNAAAATSRQILRKDIFDCRVNMLTKNIITRPRVTQMEDNAEIVSQARKTQFSTLIDTRKQGLIESCRLPLNDLHNPDISHLNGHAARTAMMQQGAELIAAPQWRLLADIRNQLARRP